jgi:hypothetical protein
VKLLGLYKRDRHYYIKVVLPKDHPLRAYFKSGRWVKSLGLCSYREAVRLATVKRAEILGNYTAVDDITPFTELFQLLEDGLNFKFKVKFFNSIFQRLDWDVGVDLCPNASRTLMS